MPLPYVLTSYLRLWHFYNKAHLNNDSSCGQVTVSGVYAKLSQSYANRGCFCLLVWIWDNEINITNKRNTITHISHQPILYSLRMPIAIKSIRCERYICIEEKLRTPSRIACSLAYPLHVDGTMLATTNHVRVRHFLDHPLSSLIQRKSSWV